MHGPSRRRLGLRMRDVLGRITREVLDVQVRIDFRRRSYASRTSRAQRVFRVVAIGNDDSGRYHGYLTNVSDFELSAEEIARTCSSRWQVELPFRCMKQHGRLDHLPSSNQHVVEALVRSPVLALVASSALLQAVRRVVPDDRHVPLLRWASLFGRLARELADLLIAPSRSPTRRLLLHLLHEVRDPNRPREDAATTWLLALPAIK